MPERIKVIFRQVEVRYDGDMCGSGEWYFIAKVNNVEINQDRTSRPARERELIPLEPAENWQYIIDVQSQPDVSVSFQVKDDDSPLSDDDMGTVGHLLRPPYAQGGLRSFLTSTHHFNLYWEVQLEVDGAFRQHPPNTVFCTRRNSGAGAGPAAGTATYSTVSGGTALSRMEICPVWPPPPDGGVGLMRPPVPAGITIVHNDSAVNIAPADNLNIIPNPAVIPLLSAPAPAAGPAPALAAGAPPRATPQTAARIEYTYYWPNTLNFTDDDPRLTWEIDPPANAAFLGRRTGLKIMAYGLTEGDVVFRVSFQGAVFAEYRAIVRPVRQILFRVNILNGPHNSHDPNQNIPRSGHADVENHIAIANRFLRQVCLELTPDANTHLTNNAVATGVNGVFNISVAAARTRLVGGSYPQSSILNGRANVLNIQYVRSIQGPAGWVVFGRSTDFAANGLGNSIDDTLLPTPSWYRPAGGGCGVEPDPAPGAAVTLNLFEAHQRAHPPNRFAMLISDDNGDPSTAAGYMTFGNVITHELGHVLSLHHRRGGGPDGMEGQPPQQNIMCQGEPANVRQDFDRLQARAMHGSPLVTA